ncbi:MAG: isopentenyl phosphate kinase family protein [Anaerolineae bacterium]|nr:isopentenyl phosphate kinase family protein [Anaerolineae bacterium]
MTANKQLIYVKLGGSVITDKAAPETARPQVIARLAAEIAAALAACPDLRLVLGHGSGSFGHPVAQRYGTHLGVHSPADWRGFAEVAAAAARLNRLVAGALLAAGVPAWSIQPSASACCRDGELQSLATGPVEQALAHGLVPLLYGDVALDEVRGGAIISTEQIFACLARRLRPARLIMVGQVDGVFDSDPLRDPVAQQLPEITGRNWAQVRALLGGSHAADVTGGMLAKVEAMVALVRDLPGLTVHLLSGLHPGALQSALTSPTAPTGGTLIHSL